MTFPWMFVLLCVICLLPMLLVTPVKKIGYKEKIKRGEKTILTLNHYSMFDIVLVVMAFPFRLMYFLGKRELWNNKLIGFMASGFGAIPISRGESDFVAIKTVVNTLNKNKTMLIFPEGTRNKMMTPEMLEIKNGVALFALKTGAKIVPMYQPNTPRPFKMNYLYIGEPFDMASIPGTKINKERLELATALLTEKLNEAKLGMEKYIEEKGIKIKRPKIKQEDIVQVQPSDEGEI